MDFNATKNLVKHLSNSPYNTDIGSTDAEKLLFTFIAKYPYHFLTVAICWSNPTQWPTQRCDF